VLLRYGVGHMSGSVSFEVKADGTAEYHSEGGGNPEKTVRGKVAPEEIAALAAVLRESDFCSLTSSRSTGVPDEARPGVRVRIEGIDCHVKLWDNEWRTSPAAQKCLSAIEGFGREIEARGTPAAP
jgi:hypothetical protein